VDNRNNGILKVKLSDAQQFVINLNYRPNERLKVKKL